MALIEDILNQLQGLGLNVGGFGDVASLNPSQIQQGMTQAYGLEPGDLPSALFSPISSDILQSSLAKTYSPMIEAGGGSLQGDLIRNLGGKEAAGAYGGFAGSYGGGQYGKQARDVYGKGMADVLSGVTRSRSQGLSNIMDIINQWKQSALQIKG